MFDDIQLTTQRVTWEQTADELWALFATTSFYQRLDSDSLETLEADARAYVERRGGKIRTSELAGARYRPPARGLRAPPSEDAVPRKVLLTCVCVLSPEDG